VPTSLNTAPFPYVGTRSTNNRQHTARERSGGALRILYEKMIETFLAMKVTHKFFEITSKEHAV
jgi:hypothetical protein